MGETTPEAAAPVLLDDVGEARRGPEADEAPGRPGSGGAREATAAPAAQGNGTAAGDGGAKVAEGAQVAERTGGVTTGTSHVSGWLAAAADTNAAPADTSAAAAGIVVPGGSSHTAVDTVMPSGPESTAAIAVTLSEPGTGVDGFSTNADVATAAPIRRASSPGLHLAPGAALLAMLVVNITVMSTTKTLNTVVCSLLVFIAVASLRRPKLLLGTLLTFLANAAVFALVAGFQPSGPINLLGPICFYIMKFTLVIAAGIYVLLTVRPSDMSSFLYQVRAPRWLSTPLTVMLRFFPQARREFQAVMEAMSLRGIPLGPRQLVTRPLRTLEHLLFPMLASCSRIADDQTASALVRGLGSDSRPTPLEPMRFGWQDAAVLVALAGDIAVAASRDTLGI
ncbi:MAG: energy-coupling factor transporter transmembrane component T [Actinomycetaceae bacterium]|nr:energy-coupling factor transporter transmembrane component T [Actinomycetaceae bacterium]